MKSQDATEPLVISVDAMGGDRGPAVVVAALAKLLKREPELQFLLHGDEATLKPLMRRWRLDGRVSARHAPNAVGMGDKPGAALRAADGTSMASALDAVAQGEAQAAVSCGNTGALMAMAMLRLRKAPGVDRPAIAVFWPSDNASGHTIVLDVGADLRAEPETLAQYAVMGAEYARVGLDLARPRVGLLNVGSEETKGRPELRAARDLLEAAAAPGAYDWRGFVEGGDLFGQRIDVVVTDGFTGNIALKTAEGAAAFLGSHLRASFKHGVLSRLAALMALGTLARLKRKIDPRRVNGGVFLGLRGAVVKSHGGADATGVAAALSLAARMARTGFTERVSARVSAMAPTAADPKEATA
jgi:glycerol-3-phosphate acyltransferase PlsX